MGEPEVVIVDGGMKCLDRLFVLAHSLERGGHHSPLRLSRIWLELGFLQ